MLKFVKYGLAIFFSIIGLPAHAEWEFGGESNVFYTDDVSIFSASQRLSHREDPTQPVIDVTGVGEDVVFEPLVSVGKLFEPSWGKLKIETQAQGFIFTEHSKFDHLTLGSQITQNLGEQTSIRFRYHYGPDLFLGLNTERQSGEERQEEEIVTTHFGTIEVEQDFSESFMVRLLGRYGERSYNRMFSQRDTRFWTIGAHAEGKLFTILEWVLGYHYERGLSAGRNLPQFDEDISSKTHYVVAEVEVRVAEKSSIKLGFDFEKNLFTSRFVDDEHHNAYENIYQGEIEFLYEINKNFDFIVEYIYGQRKFNFEPHTAKVNTVRVGGELRF